MNHFICKVAVLGLGIVLGCGGSNSGGTGGAGGGAAGAGSAGTTGNAGTTGSAGTTGNAGTTGSAGTTGNAGTTGSAGRGGGGGQGAGGQGGADCTTTGCPTGQVCYSRGAGSAIVSVECVANPCAPAALACDCAQGTLIACDQICAVTGQNIACGTRCAAPDTPIATPSGEQPIATLRPGDLVFSMQRGRLVAVPILQTVRTPAAHHHVMRVTLETGRVLHISPGHPTVDGGTFAELRAGKRLGDRHVISAALVPYPHAFTYDILPDSDSGTYVAAGALVGSTLAR